MQRARPPAPLPLAAVAPETRLWQSRRSPVGTARSHSTPAGGFSAHFPALGKEPRSRRRYRWAVGLMTSLYRVTSTAASLAWGSRPRAPGRAGRGCRNYDSHKATRPHPTGGGQWERGGRSGNAHVAAAAANERRRRP